MHLSVMLMQLSSRDPSMAKIIEDDLAAGGSSLTEHDMSKWTINGVR